MINNIKKKVLEDIIDAVIDKFKESESKINDMNVFPVPDGDTGTNMLLTLKSIKEEVLKVKNPSFKSAMENASMGALMGARGNSGVILSQIVRGFFDVLIRSDAINLDIIREAMKSSRDIAYSSVQNPTEGTMLTTIKDMHIHIEEIVENNSEISMEELLNSIIGSAEKSVERTTYLLPILKQANVVDAGAQGILEILIGIKQAFSKVESINGNLDKKIKRGSRTGKKTAAGDPGTDGGKDSMKKAKEDAMAAGGTSRNRELEEVKMHSEIKYTYCTELVVRGVSINIERLKEKIESYGDSALVVGNNSLVKIHVHTNNPQKVLNRAIREGTLHDIQINNMKDQRMEVVEAGPGTPEEPKAPEGRALIVIANGDGIEEIFKSIGVDVIVSGGQSMNPSTYDIVKAINSIDTAEVIIFPNNKNIILTANQAKKLVKKKTVTVIPTRTMPEGISAILNYNPDAGMDENAYNIELAINKSKCGEITQAVRDANLYVGEIKKGAFIGLYNGKVKVISDNIVNATIELVRDIMDGNEEVITFYTGKDVSQENIKAVKEKLNKVFPRLDIEIHRGGQPLYPFIFSIE
ncbi:MAG: DAK2 domain-containing protein [Actinobacteria bacterium]|nr:DAK2 domain-containing protein [Actinomycetota bacterium]